MPSFSAHERIKSRKLLELLYEKGDQINLFPYRLKFLRVDFEKGSQVQIVISVPKRNVKKAVRRNRLRRQIKEAYRLNKEDLLSQFTREEKGLALFLVYGGKDEHTYAELEQKLIELLKKLQKRI